VATDQGLLYVIRHGATEWSAAGKHTGLTDLELTEAGVTEARELGESLAGLEFAQVRVSPLRRACHTAELAGLEPMVLDPDLVEWDYGGYEGLTTAEIRTRLGTDWSVWTDGVVPGQTQGEGIGQLADRLDRAIAAARPALAQGNVALVAHAHSLRVLTARWLGMAPEAGRMFRLETASYGVLGLEHEWPAIRRWSVR